MGHGERPNQNDRGNEEIQVNVAKTIRPHDDKEMRLILNHFECNAHHS
ncbi:hypothetical protein [Staphylococcus lutrae]|nr:hypothetical protein [Staphylococcus lutrae]